jgi:hypothetical protein
MKQQWTNLASTGMSALVLTASIGAAGAAPAKPAAKPAPKPPANTVKGQNQLSGINGQFGVTYSLKTNFNCTLLSAAYSLEPFVAYTPLSAEADKKLFVVDFALKNIAPTDNFFDPNGFMTLVDDKGQLFPDGSAGLKDTGLKGTSITLRPGQGVGQPELKNPLQMAWSIPADARIVKIMINRGRIGKDEEVVRYMMAGASKEEAGEAGDAKNAAAPLSEKDRDPKDARGFTPLSVGPAKTGEYVTSGWFALRLDSFAYATGAILDGQEAEEGKRFAVATFTVKALTPRELSIFDVIGDPPAYEIKDGDGETLKTTFFRKLKKDEPAEREFKAAGEEYPFRVIFQIGKDSTAKTLFFGTANSRKFIVDVSTVK